MGKHAQIVLGPAGSGKSTYCQTIQMHCENNKRVVHVVNLDPAAESFAYTPSIDIRDLISLEDVMEELEYGPNGGLVYCMEYLVDNISWLEDQMDDYPDDYVIFDCPGQIELYTHLPVMKSIVECLERLGFSMCAVYLIDSLVISDASRFIAGSLMCLSAMVQLELPHINVLSKCDMVPDKKKLDQFLDPDVEDVIGMLNYEARIEHGTVYQGEGEDEQAVAAAPKPAAGLLKLNEAVGGLLMDYSMVAFQPLDISDEDSVWTVLAHIDNAMQYGEDLEPTEPRDEAAGDSSMQELYESLAADRD